MNGSAHGALRDANGRFVAGHSGNPLGKKPGTRNRATVLREALGDGEDIAAARIVIDKALSGDMVAARFIIGRLEARPRGRPIELDLPEGTSARDIVAAYDVTVRAMATGEITPDEALQVSRVLDGRLRALKMAAREEISIRAEQSPSPALAGTRGPRCRVRQSKALPRARGKGEDVVRVAESPPPLRRRVRVGGCCRTFGDRYPSIHTLAKRGMRKGLKPFTFARTAWTLVSEPKGNA
jgi:hypothetical protein